MAAVIANSSEAGNSFTFVGTASQTFGGTASQIFELVSRIATTDGIRSHLVSCSASFPPPSVFAFASRWYVIEQS